MYNISNNQTNTFRKSNHEIVLEMSPQNSKDIEQMHQDQACPLGPLAASRL